jgi:hypothetical protein
MRLMFGSTGARLYGAALGSAALALVMLFANPVPGTVHGQPAPGSTAASAASTIAVSAGSSGAGAGAGAGGQATAARPVTVAQQPAALPRTGTGLAADSGINAGAGYGLLALAAALTAAGIVVRRRQIQ